jgi:hypothetical protein
METPTGVTHLPSAPRERKDRRDNAKRNSPAHLKDESRDRTNSEVAAEGNQQTRDLGAQSKTTEFGLVKGQGGQRNKEEKRQK